MNQQNRIISLASGVTSKLPVSVKRSLYQNASIAAVIRAILNKVLPEGFSQVTITSNTEAELKMKLDLQSEKDYWLGTYEPDLQAALQDLTQPGQTVYDLGANIGYVSLLFADRIGSNGKVFAFEALPDNVTRLQENIGMNRFEDRVKIVHSAVQDHSAPATFLAGPSHGTGKVARSIGRDTINYGEKIQVPGLSLDEFVYQSQNPAPDIIKIDIEGGEALALAGMRQILHEYKPIIFLELHGPEAAHSCWRMLDEEGYRICEMTANYPVILDWTELGWKSYILAFPEGYAS